MKFLAAVVAVFCLVQSLEARVARDAPQPVTFETLMNDALSHFNNFTNVIKNALPSNDEFKTSLQSHASNFAEQLQKAVTEFNAKAKDLSGDAQTSVQRASEQLQTQVNNLRQQFPNAAEGANKLKASIESALAEARHVQEALQPHADAVAESLKSAMRTTVEQATLVSNQVQQQVQQASQAH